ncbi:hypothetical protein TWF281_003500 [Arthrobotrys megalospora]
MDGDEDDGWRRRSGSGVGREGGKEGKGSNELCWEGDRGARKVDCLVLVRSSGDSGRKKKKKKKKGREDIVYVRGYDGGGDGDDDETSRWDDDEVKDDG